MEKQKPIEKEVEQIKKSIQTLHENKKYPMTDIADALEDIAGEADTLLDLVTEDIKNGRGS
jgi:type II secretory pathway predicted ATPase ExeA